ncbi:hypothetical protein KOR42_36040 [Thalassoglobus neptunius]|uniref:Uncharacterized protein n=1 Tax=Thalassoglobus neptunius TaxID=1938619 RepID=A0A5C5WH06_9PLAN|nr:hypothetical protein KOR42_36040 [Thalassoglobus neptunius]
MADAEQRNAEKGLKTFQRQENQLRLSGRLTAANEQSTQNR